MGLPIGLFLFQLWGCPASALSVAGNGGGVLQAHPFFGTVDWCLFETSLPLLRYPVSLQRSGCACLGLRPCGKCFFFFFLWMGTQNGQNVPLLESASLEKRKRSVIKQFYKISKKS